MQNKQDKRFEASKPKPDKTFQKTVWLQIYIPFIFILLLLGAIVAVVWVGGVGSYSGWADSALVILIIPALVLGLILFVILAGLCYGVMVVIGWIPEPAKRVQEISTRVATETRRFADLAVRPLLAPKAAKTAVIETLRYLASIFSKEG
jgi:hypothetical protein